MNKRSFTTSLRDSPPLKQADIDSGKVVLRTRNALGQIQPLKQRINIYLDATVVKHFKKKAGPRGYQTLINDALRSHLRLVDPPVTQELVRMIVREELAAQS